MQEDIYSIKRKKKKILIKKKIESKALADRGLLLLGSFKKESGDSLVSESTNLCGLEN